MQKYGPDKGQALFNDWCWGLDPDAGTTIVDNKAAGIRNILPTTQQHLGHPIMASMLKASTGTHKSWIKERVQRSALFAKVVPYGHPSNRVDYLFMV